LHNFLANIFLKIVKTVPGYDNCFGEFSMKNGAILENQSYDDFCPKIAVQVHHILSTKRILHHFLA
jgi:hypothetical protein